MAANHVYDPELGVGTITHRPVVKTQGGKKVVVGQVTAEYTVIERKTTTLREVSRRPNEVRAVFSLSEVPGATGVPAKRINGAYQRGLLPKFDIQEEPGYYFSETVIRIRDLFILRLPRDAHFNAETLAEKLHKGRSWPYQAMDWEELTPAQSILGPNWRPQHFFLVSDFEALQKRHDPDHVPYAYKIARLKKLLGRPRDFVRGAILRGDIDPEKIGPDSRPAYIVPPEKMKLYRDILNPGKRKISFFRLKRRFRRSNELMARVAAEIGINVTTRKDKGGHTVHEIDRNDIETLRAHFPKRLSRKTISLQKLLEKLGTRQATLEKYGIQAHDAVPHGKKTHYTFDRDRLPLYLRSKSAFRKWLRRKQTAIRKAAVALLVPLLIPASAGYLGLGVWQFTEHEPSYLSLKASA
jgi:hypothetical protein